MAMPGPGDTFAGHAIRRLLGQGTSGAVYVAQACHDGRWVALKLLNPPAGTDSEDQADMRTRFLAESRVALRLRHTDIVATHAAGETDGQLWLAMELVPGCSLARYTTARRLLPPTVAVDLAARLAAALAHAHAAGIVHRDVKPSNVLVDLPSETVKLSDFGIARLDDGATTRTGMMLGTPAYMAPEQLAGAPADARGDIYALGVILFELLTGRRPHDGASMGEFLRAVATQAPPDVRVLMPQAPVELAELLAHMLAPQPGARIDSAAQLVQALERARVHMAPRGGLR
jgi:eukaryotic-like serine/threonine-protein kinase